MKVGYVLDDFFPESLNETFKLIRQLDEIYGLDKLIDASYQMSNIPNDIVKQMDQLTPTLQFAGILSSSPNLELEKSQKAFFKLDRTLTELSNASINLNNLVSQYAPYLKQHKELESYFNVYPQFKEPLKNIFKDLETNTAQENILNLQNTVEFEDTLQENTDNLETNGEKYSDLQLFLIKIWLHTKNQDYVHQIMSILVFSLINFIGSEISDIIDLPSDIESLLNGTVQFIKQKKEESNENKAN